MGSTVARIRWLDSRDERVYVLNWLGKARQHPEHAGRYQVYVRFVEKGGTRPAHAWVPLEQFPLLILGSVWHKGVMVDLPLGGSIFQFKLSGLETWHVPSCTPKEGMLHFGDGYALAIDNPAAPVMEVRSLRGDVLYLPLSELLRAHYFFLPRAIASLTGGLLRYGSLAGEGLEAWHPSGTFWLDESLGRAQLHKGKHIDDYNAVRLARLLFDPRGRAGINKIHSWVEREFTAVSWGGGREKRSDLPKLTLPYTSGYWRAAARPLGQDDQGNRRFLILQIESFEAPEPYQDLALLLDGHEAEDGGGTENAERTGHNWGQMIFPDTPDVLDVVDKPGDGGMAPVILERIVPIDRDSKLRRPQRRRRGTRPTNPPKPGAGAIHQPVIEGTTLGPDTGGSGRAPVVFGSQEWPRRKRELQDIAKQIMGAAQWIVKAHHAKGLSASCCLLPDEDRSYSFVVPSDDTGYAVSRAHARQFLVVQVQIGARYAYIIEPEHRVPSDSFPLGVWATRHPETHHPLYEMFTTEHIQAIAIAFETAYREGGSWVRAPYVPAAFISEAIRHAPKDNPTSTASEGFRRRIIARVVNMIGDVGVIIENF